MASGRTEGEGPPCKQKRLVSLSAPLCCGSRWNQKAAMAFSSCEHTRGCRLGARGSAYLPSVCLASCGLQGMAGPALRLRCSACFGGELDGSWPAAHLCAVLKGLLLFLLCCTELWKGVFPSCDQRAMGALLSCSELPEQRLCKACTVFMRPV